MSGTMISIAAVALVVGIVVVSILELRNDPPPPRRRRGARERWH